MEKLRKMASVTAIQHVKDGMIIGLRTGSTAYSFAEKVDRRVKKRGLKVVGVATPSQTTARTGDLGILLKVVDNTDVVDVVVDGADEVDINFSGIRSGGGALLMGKVAATSTKEYIWVVGESRTVDKLGAFKSPVEVVQYDVGRIFHEFEKGGCKPSYRMINGERFMTDMKNHIIDSDPGIIRNPVGSGKELKVVIGAVEYGLFNGIVNKVIVADKNGVGVLEVK